MKHWEEAALLTEVLDRHADRLLREIPSSDWTLFWHIEPFLRLLAEEPILSGFVREYVEEEVRISDELGAALVAVREVIAALLADNESTLRALTQKPDQEASDVLEEALRCLRSNGPIDLEKCTSALDTIVGWLPTDPESSSRPTELATLKEKLSGLQTRWHQLEVAFRVTESTHPGAAYRRLCRASHDLQYRNAPVDSDQNKRTRGLHRLIRESDLWLGMNDGTMPQSGVVNLQRSVYTLHLALVTTLARGRSRWATVKRFAARCESLDRERLRILANGSPARPEAALTLDFARYLFDAGYNSLVDAAACGLRPDVFDVTAEPAIYVEAKQYEGVSDAIIGKLRKDLAQTLNTWSRLANRWNVPEAFLLVFRRSGRSIEFENAELRVGGGRLYVLCVDLAEASESGSRAEVPVRIDLKALLEAAKKSASSASGEDHG